MIPLPPIVHVHVHEPVLKKKSLEDTIPSLLLMSTQNICFCGEKNLILPLTWSYNTPTTHNTRKSQKMVIYLIIAPDKAPFFSTKKVFTDFLFLNGNICCGYSLEVPRWGTSNEYPQHIFLYRNKKRLFLILPLIWSYDTPTTDSTRFKKYLLKIVYCIHHSSR